MPLMVKRGSRRVQVKTTTRRVLPRGWTLDGREAIVDQKTYIVRSCPRCLIERFAPADDVPALDDLREWAFGHSAFCLATSAKNVSLAWSPAVLRSTYRAARPMSAPSVGALA